MQSSAISVTAGLGVGEDLLYTDAGPLAHPSSLNPSQNNLLSVLRGALDGLETLNITNVHLRDHSLFMNSMALYNVHPAMMDEECRGLAVHWTACNPPI